MDYFPKESFDLFSERVKLFASRHKDKKDLHAYLERLRRHHKGEEIMNEFVIDPAANTDNKDGAMEQDPLAPLDPMADGFDVEMQDEAVVAKPARAAQHMDDDDEGQIDTGVRRSRRRGAAESNGLGLVNEEPLQPRKFTFTAEQMKEIEERKQAALNKKRKR